MGKRTGGGGPSSVKVKGPPRWWCYYCDTRHEGELQLIQHQRHKHFLCRLCDPKSYGRNCLSLSGLISHVRRSHRQEITEVPGAIEGRRSTDVEVSAMNGIPQAALDAFEEKFAEEMMAHWPGRAPEPAVEDSDEEEEEAPPPKPQEPIKPTDEKKEPTGGKKGVVIPDMAWIASQLATSDGQYNNLELERPPIQLPGMKQGETNKDIQAFDASLLARVQAGASLPTDLEQEREELARQEEVVRQRAEEKAKKEEEKRRRAISIAFLPKKDKEEKPVPKVDKSVVSDWGFAIKARANQAKESVIAQSDFKTAPQTLKTKLVAMQPGALLKFAVESGVNKDDIMKAQGSKDFITQLILQMEIQEAWKTVTFKPGKIGLKADWARGEVESVTADGQGQALGVQVGWVFKKVDGERFSKAALQERIGGVLDYKAVFATSDAALLKSRGAGGGRYKPGGILRPPKKKQKVETRDGKTAAKPRRKTEEHEPKRKGRRRVDEYDAEDAIPAINEEVREEEEDHCLPGECEEEDHCLPGECEEEEKEDAKETRPRRRDDDNARRARRQEYEGDDNPRRGRRNRDRDYQEDDRGYRQDRRGRRYDDRDRYEYEEDEYEYEYEDEEEEDDRGRRYDRRGRGYDREVVDRGRGHGRRGRDREEGRGEEYDPYAEIQEEEEEAPKGDKVDKGDPNKKRGAARLLPREEK